MKPPLNIVVLWHMHQPYYVNPLTKTAMMPWVRLHAVKGYLDMIDIVDRHPEIRVNMNFTPVLVKQLLELAEGSVTDLWSSWARTPAAELDDAARAGLLEHYFKINWANLIEPFPRYRELLDMRGREATPEALHQALSLYTERDFRDLQVWFNLGWCGYAAVRRYPELAELRAKGHDFTEAEKNRVLDIHFEIVREVLGFYRKAEDEGRVEVTTTPFFHPIMPLVYDTSFAERAMPGREFPEPFGAPEDVAAHLRLAQEQHEKVFGRKARGLWPSEGSVAPELLPLLKEAGIQYFCTDEDVLFRSLAADTSRGAADHMELFQPWECEYAGSSVRALFRERPLSDFIGFNASRRPAEDAADYLLHHLEHIASITSKPDAVLCLALDGENAWEFFADGGEAFIDGMYSRFEKSPVLKTRRLGDYFAEVTQPAKVARLHTGSWIQANFDIWIGDAEENQGWEWIGKTRRFLVDYLKGHDIAVEVAEKAWLEIYAAEGSDWFWWYGPDFHTDCDMLFDELFRTHLQNVYHVLGEAPPAYLAVPIRRKGRKDTWHAPTAYISPTITGDAGHYFDWLGAGYLDPALQQSAMYQSGRLGRAFYFGFDEKNFYFRIDLENGSVPNRVRVHFCKPKEVRLVIEPQRDRPWCTMLVEGSGDGVHFEAMKTNASAVYGSKLEWQVDLASLGLEGCGDALAFTVHLEKDGVEKERYPAQGMIELKGPSAEFALANWVI